MSEIFASDSDNELEAELQEITKKKSYLDIDSQFDPYNPDDLVQKNQDFSLYEDMLKDDQVNVCLQLKKDLVLCSGYDFISEEDGQEEVVKDLRIALEEDPWWSFEEMLEEIISAYEFGFSISEKVFQKRKDGKLSLKYLKTRHPGPWLMHMDDSGNVVRYEQRGSSGTIQEIPPESIIHFINKRKFQNPYGTSDLRAAYQAWFAKTHISRYYSIFIEKAASPIPVAKYDKQASNKAVTDIYNAIRRFQTKTALAIPKYIEVDFLESSSNGEAFVKGINIFNMFIGRSLLIPDLLGFQGSETSGGSFALGKSQMEVFFRHIQRRQALLERTINNEIIWPIVLHNFGFMDSYPKFKFRPISNEQIIESARIWLDAVKSNVYKPNDLELNHFKDIINFPTSVEEESVEVEPASQADFEPELYPVDDGDETSLKKNLQKSPRKFANPNGSFHEKVNFDLIEKNLDTALDSFSAISEKLVEEIFNEFESQIDKKKIVQTGKIEKLDSLDIKKTGALRIRLFNDLKNLFKKGKEIASSEIFKTKFAKPKADKAFESVIEQETFQFVGDWKFNVTKKARAILIAAIKDGSPISKVVAALQGEIKGASKKDLERFTKTKFTEVMNKGRRNFYDETKVVQGYQYASTLDDRTTEICRGLHGKKFIKGTEPVPPMHFNCRAMLIPITIFEGFEADKKIGKKNVDDFIEEKKGLGFPKQ